MNITYALLIGVVPTLLWLWFWLKEDNLHPEPRSIIAISFIAGCTSVIVAIIVEGFFKDIIVGNETFLYIAWALTEELVKFTAIAIVALRSIHMDEPIDAMIYSITVALGFSALENVFFILFGAGTGELSNMIITSNLRFLGATLVHVVSSASIGFMIGLSFYKNSFTKVFSVIIGVILATVLHASFNLAIINASDMNALKVFGWVWFSVIILMILFVEEKNIKQNEVL